MKKAMSLLLVMAMIFTTMCPVASAADAKSRSTNGIIDSFEKQDDAGNVMSFELLNNSEGGYTLNYYLNNVLTTSYKMTDTSPNIKATTMENATEKEYTLQVENPVMMRGPVLMGPDRWGHAGYIKYGYSNTFACEPWGIVSYKDTDSYVGTYTVNTYENSSYSDWVAVITSVLIGAGMGLLAPASLAAGILAGMIGYYGSEVINDVISIPFIEEYECSSVTYTMRAQVIGTGMGDTDVVDYEGGVDYWIKYVDAPDEYVSEGWTPRTWKCREFGQKVWADSVPFWPPCPTILGYPTYM